MSLVVNEINFKGDNPGAVRYGNFINYYQFHSAENRIKMLPSDIWNTIETDSVCLDIGCNAGDLTIALNDYLLINATKNVNFLGIDMDPTLITRAEEKNENKQKIHFKCLDIMNKSQQEVIENYLSSHNKPKFDVTFCFSITMWIHLNNGDDGLERFLSYISTVSNMIVIEPQPWKCYRTAVKRLKLSNHEFPYFKDLKIRSSVENFIEQYIIKQSFVKIHESPNSEWGRKILFFVQKT